MQQSVDHWGGLVQATGGTLVPAKCFWYVTKNQQQGEITIKDEKQQMCGDTQIGSS